MPQVKSCFPIYGSLWLRRCDLLCPILLGFRGYSIVNVRQLSHTSDQVRARLILVLLSLDYTAQDARFGGTDYLVFGIWYRIVAQLTEKGHAASGGTHFTEV